MLTPLLKANKRGSSSCEWKKAYQAVKHNRTESLSKGSIKNLLRALGALFILNLYFKDEMLNFKRDSYATNFPINMSSDIFAIQLHGHPSYDGSYNYIKRDNFNECIYLIRMTTDSLEKCISALEEGYNKQLELFLKHPKFLEYYEKGDLMKYQGQNLMWDVLGKDDYYKIIGVAQKDHFEKSNASEYEAIVNKNMI